MSGGKIIHYICCVIKTNHHLTETNNNNNDDDRNVNTIYMKSMTIKYNLRFENIYIIYFSGRRIFLFLFIDTVTQSK